MSLHDIDMRDAFFDEVYDLATNDSNIIFLTADHAAFSLEKFKKDLPKQYYNVGIAEQNMINVAAGLALSGKRVFVYSIASFTTFRCLEQINVCLATMQLPVSIVGVGAGFTYSIDGPTHHGTQDVSAMSSIPGLTILNSSDAANTKAFARMAIESQGPHYIRIEKGVLPTLYDGPGHTFADGVAVLSVGRDVTIVATGVMVHRALEVADELRNQHAMDVGVVDLYRIKPLNNNALLPALSDTKKVVTLEEHIKTGGIGSMVASAMMENGLFVPFKRIAIEDQHCFKYGDREWVQESCGLGKEQIVQKICSF